MNRMIKGNTKRRRLAWLSAAFFTGAALLMPATMGAVLANPSHQTLPIASSTGQLSCDGVTAGNVLWHFIQNQTEGVSTGKLTATFTTYNGGAPTVVDSYKITPGGVLHWEIITGDPDTLLSFSSNVESDGELNLSHIYVCKAVTTTSTTTGTTTTGTTTTGTTTTGTTTVNTTTGTGDVSGTTTVNTTTLATGNVSGTTSTKTLPETSTIEPTSPVNSGMISLAFLLLGAGSLMLLVLTPAQARKRD
ncbi:MAG: hypothetical protein WEG56_05830 [Chloroflexota bacterium]